MLQAVAAERGYPTYLRSDNGLRKMFLKTQFYGIDLFTNDINAQRFLEIENLHFITSVPTFGTGLVE